MKRFLAMSLLVFAAACGDSVKEKTDDNNDDNNNQERPDPFIPPEGCNYIPGGSYVIQCGDTYEWLNDMITGDENCPVYYVLGEETWASIADAALANDCSADCSWSISSSLSGTICANPGSATEEQFGECTTFSPSDASCGDLADCYTYLGDGAYDGWYEGWADFRASVHAQECPDFEG